MHKVALGITGLIIGGFVGYLVAMSLVVLVSLFDPPEPMVDPMVGFGPALLIVFVGIPVGALVGCVLGVVFADKIMSKLGKRHKQLPAWLAVALVVCLLIWFLMESIGGW